MGGSTLGTAAVQVHHISLRGSGSDGPGDELVAWAESDFMVKTVEIWAGIYRQSGSGGESCRATIEQEGNADDGWHHDRADAQLFDVVVGAGEHAGAIDAAFSGSADRAGILRRLRENHSAKQRRDTFDREALGAGSARTFHRSVPLEKQRYKQTDQ